MFTGIRGGALMARRRAMRLVALLFGICRLRDRVQHPLKFDFSCSLLTITENCHTSVNFRGGYRRLHEYLFVIEKAELSLPALCKRTEFYIWNRLIMRFTIDMTPWTRIRIELLGESFFIRCFQLSFVYRIFPWRHVYSTTYHLFCFTE